MITEISPLLKKELIKEIKIEVKRELLKELFEKVEDTRSNWLVLKNIIQRTKDWRVVNSFLTLTEAAKITWISKSGISQCISWRTQSAWGFIWENIN